MGYSLLVVFLKSLLQDLSLLLELLLHHFLFALHFHSVESASEDHEEIDDQMQTDNCDCHIAHVKLSIQISHKGCEAKDGIHRHHQYKLVKVLHASLGFFLEYAQANNVHLNDNLYCHYRYLPDELFTNYANCNCN